MGVVIVSANPFEPTQREVHRTRRPQTIRRFIRRTQKSRTVMKRGANGRRYREFRLPTVCFVNGRPLMRAHWSTRTIGERDVVTFQTYPTGGGGGGGSNPLMIVLAIAVAVAVPLLAAELAPVLATGLSIGLTTAKIIGGVLIGLVGFGLMSLFISAPTPPTADNSGAFGGAGNAAQSSPTYNFSAQGNTARLGQPIPEWFGRMRGFPDFAHTPYQSFSGNDQYLHYLLCVTKGELEIEKVQIGDTPVANFPEITWEQVEPGATVPTSLVDPMMLVSGDLAQTELEGSEAGSPVKGPFIVNPATTTIEKLEIDYGAPQGLYYVNDNSSLANRGFTFTVEIQEIDDDGASLGGWTLIDTVTESEAKRTPLRWTRSYTLAAAGRYQVRLKRTDAKDTNTRSGDAVEWIGLRGLQPGTRTFPGVTLLAMKLKATGNLNGQSSKQVNIIGTRKLATWDEEEGAMTETLAATRNPCDAAAYVCLAQNGARLAERQVDLAGIYSHKDDYDTRGWTFDGIFDTSVTVYEALSRIGRCVVAQPVVQGSRVRLVRDLPSTAPAMVFSQRNIAQQSFEIDYKMPDERTADAVEVQFVNSRSFKPDSVTVALEDSLAENPSTLPLFGCTNREQARFVGFMFARANRYRRRGVSFGTEMEGLLLLYGDPVVISHDMPAWGQAAEAVEFDEGTRTITVDQPLTFAEEGTHYAALRQRDGTMSGPYTATAVEGDPKSIVLGAGDLPDLSLDGDAERTHVLFGLGENYAKPMKVMGVTPRSEYTADVILIDDDPRMHAAIPEEE